MVSCAARPSRPVLSLILFPVCDPSSPLPPRHEGTPTRSRKELALQGLPSYNLNRPQESAAEIDAKMKEIMKQNGVLTIQGKVRQLLNNLKLRTFYLFLYEKT